MIWTIIAKDLRQHRRSLLIFASVALVLSLSDKVAIGNDDLTPVFHRFLFSYVTILTPMELAMWFVSQEKVKETIHLLRLLPISPGKLMAAKMFGIALISEAFYIGSSLVMMTEHLMRTHTLALPGWDVLLLLPVPILTTSVLTPMYVRFHYKVAGLISLMVYAGFFMVGSVIFEFLFVPSQASSAGNALITAVFLWALAGLSFLGGWFVARLSYGRAEEVGQLIDE